jgi:ATP-dependent RNA circularization protein (DNA/RNA ligase family)
MKWLTSNRLYFYNPKMSEINSTSIENYRRIFIITDLSYLRTHDSKNCIWHIINKVNDKVRLRIIFIRPDKRTKKKKYLNKQSNIYKVILI